MKVSILIPVYGVEEDIAQCAESLFTQTYPHLEYVFVDDCSPDRSVEVLQQVVARYPERQQQVRILHNSRNLGSGETRNVALDAATGELVMFVDSDDYLPQDAIEKMVKVMRQTDADMVEGAFQPLKAEGLGGSEVPYRSCSPSQYVKVILSQELARHALWAKLYRRSVIADSGIRFVSGVTNMEDYCFIARLACFLRKRVTMADVVYVYRNTATSFFSRVGERRNALSMVRANWAVRRFYKEYDKEHRYTFALLVGLMNMIRKGRSMGLRYPMFQTMWPASVYSFFYKMLRVLCLL